MIKLSRGLVEVISRLIFNYSWSVIIAFSVLGVLAFFYTAQNLGVNSNTAEMFDEDLSFRQIRDRYKDAFPVTEDNFVIVVSGAVPELVGSTADSIAKDLKNHPHLFESVYQPTRETFFKRNQLLFLDTAALETISTQLAKSRPMMSFLAENYSLKGLFSFLGLVVRFSSPEQLEGMSPLFHRMDSTLIAASNNEIRVMSWQNLMGNQEALYPSGYSFIQIKPVLDYHRVRPAKPAIEEAKRIISVYNKDQVKVRITGKKAMTYEEMGSVMDGAIQASVLALIMVSLVLWIGIRSLRLIAATLISLIIGLILTAAFSAWAVGSLNMISVAFAVLYIGLGVDYAIHLCLRYRELGQDGKAIKESLISSINHVGPALLLSTLSTSIGFYAFVPTAFKGVSELGIIAGTGMFISLLVTLTLLPCLIWKLSAISRFKPSIAGGFSGPQIENYSSPIRMVTVILGLVAIMLLPGVEFDYDPINLRDPDSESVSTIRELMSTGSFTPWSLNILTNDSSRLNELSDQLIALETVDRVVNIKSFVPKNQLSKLPIIKEIQTVLNEVGPYSYQFDAIPLEEQVKAVETFSALLSSSHYQAIPGLSDFSKHLASYKDSILQSDTADQVVAIQKLQTGLLKALPYTIAGLKQINARMVSFESLPRNLTEQWISSTGDLRTQILPIDCIRTNQQMRVFATDVQEVAPEATGDLTVTLASGDTVVKAFKQAIIYAILAIAVLLLIYLRSIRETLYILLPLILAGAFTGAFTVVLGIDFNFANIIALPLLLGLGVDNGVHIVHRAKTEENSQGLLRTSTARAIFFSSLTTLFSFGNLAFSPHKGTASMGWLLTIGVLFVLIATLIVLPAFLWKSKHRGP